LEEKLKYHSQADLERGEYNGYRPAGLREIVDGIHDNVQVYNIPKFDGFHQRNQPRTLQDNIEEIEKFSRVSRLMNVANDCIDKSRESTKK